MANFLSIGCYAENASCISKNQKRCQCLFHTENKFNSIMQTSEITAKRQVLSQCSSAPA